MPIQKRYNKSSEQALANYDFEDIAEGTGLKAFYLAISALDGDVKHNLIPYQVYSCSGQIITSSDKTYEFYSPEFNLPRKIHGTAYLNLGFHVNSNTANIRAQLKLSGSQMINLTSEVSGATLTGDLYGMEFYKMPIMTPTTIKRGDQLRLTLKLSKAGAGNIEIGTNPMGLLGSFDSGHPEAVTSSRILIPFKIDL